MPHDEWAECPNCGRTAWGRSEIEAEFGYRYGGKVPQLWYCQVRIPAGSERQGNFAPSRQTTPFPRHDC